MFFLFGWGHQTKRDFGQTFPLHCQHCNNDSYWTLVYRKLWFTLFFVPVIPYEFKYYLLCPVCSWGIELLGKQIEIARELNKITHAYLNKQMTDDQYRLLLNRTPLLGAKEEYPRLPVGEEIQDGSEEAPSDTRRGAVPNRNTPQRLFWYCLVGTALLAAFWVGMWFGRAP